MKINITKAHGTKNTFVIIFDSMHQRLVKSNISKICETYQTDGLLLLSEHNKYDYKMDYYNNDGTWETMCANGARCAVLYMQNQIKQNKECSIINLVSYKLRYHRSCDSSVGRAEGFHPL